MSQPVARNSFRRAEGDWPRDNAPQWFIKGSYVLDVIFDRRCAGDVDVFYNREMSAPTPLDIEAWLEERGWWQANPDISAGDFAERGGGAQDRFNIDLLHINMDGRLGIMQSGTSEPISLDDAAKLLAEERLQLLVGQGLPEPDDGSEPGSTRDYLEKVLRKMTVHPELANEAIRTDAEHRLSDEYTYEPEPGVGEDLKGIEDDDFF